LARAVGIARAGAHSKSELVIEAQRASVDAFLNDGGWKLVMNS
jgi:hypothetical protein